jgi:hypothetical protein
MAIGRHVDWLQSLSPQQIPHCPDRRCQIYLQSGVNAELTRQKLYHARLMHAPRDLQPCGCARGFCGRSGEGAS